MKVIHVLKKIEEIDQDIKELRKLEKSVTTNKSFTTPIFMSIEKQINIMLGERIKLLELTIENPPETMQRAIEGDEPVKSPILTPSSPSQKGKKPSKSKQKKGKMSARKGLEEEEIRMLTQDDIDSRISLIQREKGEEKPEKEEKGEDDSGDESVKLLDIALEKGTLNSKEETKDKKVRFFRDNFPLD
ncbi:MAG: hypothetical protein JXA20_17220 [Spirochaetes bacterium]|nr:hypothetical protein [Spirochaetota bacterium]